MRVDLHVLPDSISIGSAVSAGFTVMTNAPTMIDHATFSALIAETVFEIRAPQQQLVISAPLVVYMCSILQRLPVAYADRMLDNASNKQ